MKKIIGLCLSLLLAGVLIGQTNNNERTLFVDGICGMCKTRIEAAAVKVRGVQAADWVVETRQLTVTVNPQKFDETQLHQAIANVGHDTELVKATDEAYDQLHGCCKYRDQEIIDQHRSPEENDGGASLDENERRLFVDGICGMCKTRIEAAALTAPGIVSADWVVDTRQLTVTIDPEQFDETQLHWTITGVGHDTELWKASDEAYDQLHGCCKYRDQAIIDQHRKPEANEVVSQAVKGVIEEEAKRNRKTPIIGATVQWLGAKNGTITDIEGRFELDRVEGIDQLVISYVGYAPDTIDLLGQEYVQLTLSEAVSLAEVEVKYRRRTTEVSFIDPLKFQEIGSGELLKAACCNLSESFETNPAVDASVTDAVTGTRQIELLGLAGPYVQISRENIPDIRGLSALYGMTYTPGPWIQSIQLLKGPGPVVNGFESMAGQINVELKKPCTGERMHLNFYGNEGQRVEGNLNWRKEFSENWSTAILLHGQRQRNTNDRNDDGFLDNPLRNDWIALNRWKWLGKNGWRGQFGLKGTFIDRQSGEVAFDPEKPSIDQVWGADLQTQRAEGWAKIGKVYTDRPYASLGFQVSGVYHDQQSLFGQRTYNAEQQSLYANFIYQSIFGTTEHQWKAGASFQYDQYDEQLSDAYFERSEWVPGAYFEYTYLPTDEFTLVAGLRGDYHNIFGFFATPRVFARFSPNNQTVFRVSAGQGRRTASIIAENVGALATARQWVIEGQNPDLPYGLNQEISWNVGVNFTHSLKISQRELLISVDAYRTMFEQQIVVDYDQDPQELHFYNLDGKSYSNSLQVQADYELLPRFDVRVAYRLNDVQTQFEQGLLQKPLVARHRAFLNLAYQTNNDWAFDFTLNRQGDQRIPFTQSNPEEYRLAERSPAFFLANTQVSKTWNEIFSIYVGAENLFDYRQDNPIIAAEDPFGEYFDSSLVWGPVFGRMIYAGLRYTIE